MLSDTPMAKKSEQISVRLDDETFATLGEINSRHGLEPVLVARRCLEAVTAFYRENGYFAFPVKILPEREFLAAVMKTTEAAEVAELAEKLPKAKPRKAS